MYPVCLPAAWKGSCFTEGVLLVMWLHISHKVDVVEWFHITCGRKASHLTEVDVVERLHISQKLMW